MGEDRHGDIEWRLHLALGFFTAQLPLTGHRLQVYLYGDRLDCILGSIPMMVLQYGQPTSETKGGHVFDC
jgi:hypothetical protein